MTCFISVLFFGCATDSSVSEKIPLIFFTQTAPDENETTLAYSSDWQPQQGSLDLNPNPSFELVKSLDLHWQGKQQIIFSPRPDKTEMPVNFKNITNDFEIITSQLKTPAQALNPLYYAGESKEYLAYGLENKIILLENQGDKTIENAFAVPENDGETIEVIPVLLSLRDKEPILLVVVNNPVMPAEKLYLLNINGKNATWTLVSKADTHCSYIASGGMEAIILNSHVYMSDPCGEGVLAFNLEEKVPTPVPVATINQELKLAIKANPSEAQVDPHFGVYNDILLVRLVTGGAQGKDNLVEWLWAFKGEKLLGKIAIAYADEKITVYSNGKEVDSKNLPGIKSVLLPFN